MKILSHLFSVLLMLASQRIESLDFTEDSPEAHNQKNDEEPTKRGAAPTLIEWTILSWVSGEYHSLKFPIRCQLRGRKKEA